jgi:hypothetical protein
MAESGCAVGSRTVLAAGGYRREARDSGLPATGSWGFEVAMGMGGLCTAPSGTIVGKLGDLAFNYRSRATISAPG